MFAVERHVFPVRNHGVGNVEGPALHPDDDHAAPLGGDEAASCEDAGQCESTMKAKNGAKDKNAISADPHGGATLVPVETAPYLCKMAARRSSCRSTGR